MRTLPAQRLVVLAQDRKNAKPINQSAVALLRRGTV
jgi:hypothetical protein